MTDLSSEFVRQWPGRFRFGQLLVCLDGGQSPDPDVLTDAVLDGIAKGREHDGVLIDLIRDGHFATARRMLVEDAALTSRQLARARNELDLYLAKYCTQLSDQLRQISDLADAAGLPLEADREALERLCRDSWPDASAQLEEIEKDLRARIAQIVGTLENRLQAAQLRADVESALRSLLRSGRLLDAAWMLEQRNLGSPGPEAVRPLPRWTWISDSPEDVLGWHLDPGLPRPSEFSGWAVADDSAHRLLADFHSLSGSETTAQAFAESLDAFLGPTSEAPPLNRVADGYLTKIGNIFADPELSVFGAGQAVDLFIADPWLTATPPELSGIGRMIAAGPSMEAASNLARDGCAVLGLRELLRLATVADRRPVALLRILAQQWPLSALGAGSAGHLEALLGRDPNTRWRILRWIVDLTGVGDFLLAGVLAFHTGYQGPLLHVLLDHLAETTGTPAADPRRWSDDEQLSSAMESAALREIHGLPDATMAFWAALASAPPGETVTLDEMVLSTALDSDGTEWEKELRRGLGRLSRLWCADVVDDSSVTLQPHGVIIELRGKARRRISELAEQLAAQTAEPTGIRPLDSWDAYQYALGDRWHKYHGHLLQEGDGTLAEETREQLRVQPEQLAEQAARADVTGQTDLAKLTAEMRKILSKRYPLVTLSVEGPPSASARINERAAMVLMHALLSNAVEALPEGGTVSVTFEPTADGAGDLIVEVRDSGSGLAADITRDHLVFRRGVSTKGTERGIGLPIARDLARRVGGDLELVARAGRHPVLGGAHFRLILPGAH